ncbi:sulfotransferase family protein [Thermaurantiacus sp.]
MAQVSHPLSGADWGTLSAVLAEAGPGVDRRRLAAIRAAILGRLPFTLAERALAPLLLPRLADLPPPVFILGHWRSGTTHLYNLLSLGDFAYVPPVAVGLPWETLGLARLLRPALERALPESRFIDAIPVTPTSPQEDEIALANMSPLSFYHAIYFPRAFDHFLARGLFFEGASPALIEAWKAAFGLFLRKLAYLQGKPLLIKNPVYTARPAMLAALFPGAKFIHIHRDPFEVALSMRNFWRRLLEVFALQPWDHVDIDQTVLAVFDRMMARFEAETQGWGPPRFVEVAYADLDQHPLATVEGIYRALELPGFEAAAPRVQRYLARLGTYARNRFRGEAPFIRSVEQSLARWIAKWGYRTPDIQAS